MIRDLPQIQSRLDELITRENARSKQLDDELIALQAKYPEVIVSHSEISEVTMGDEVRLSVGNRIHNIRAQILYDDLVSNAFPGKGKIPIGYIDDSGREVLIQNNDDIKWVFRWYFAQQLDKINIISIQPEDIEQFNAFNFRKIQLGIKDPAVFKVEAVEDAPLVLIGISTKLNMEKGFDYLRSVFGPFVDVVFKDDADDLITVDSEESWDYLKTVGATMARVGKYPELFIHQA